LGHWVKAWAKGFVGSNQRSLMMKKKYRSSRYCRLVQMNLIPMVSSTVDWGGSRHMRYALFSA
jgi:hypothetical protein